MLDEKTKLLNMQFERLIHLIVTMTVGMATLISCLATIVYKINSLLIIDGVLIILFFFYILHYRKLENTVQSWYSSLDKPKLS
jgi:hypothetical protein